jgi:hypothetical protein
MWLCRNLLRLKTRKSRQVWHFGRVCLNLELDCRAAHVNETVLRHLINMVHTVA